MEGLQTAMETAFGAVKTDVLGVVTKALPIGLGIAGIFIAVRLGIKFFKGVTK